MTQKIETLKKEILELARKNNDGICPSCKSPMVFCYLGCKLEEKIDELIETALIIKKQICV